MINENRIPVIIVSYRNPNDVAECLSALSQLTADPAFDVFLCENGGSAAFDALISSLSEPDGPCDQDASFICRCRDLFRCGVCDCAARTQGSP
jgi:N-acetylglucosaminyl-diphospho-decaprenol L-rhamnosyltransferase